MEIRPKLRRPCFECGEMFLPKGGRCCKYCKKCLKLRKKRVQEKINEKRKSRIQREKILIKKKKHEKTRRINQSKEDTK